MARFIGMEAGSCAKSVLSLRSRSFFGCNHQSHNVWFSSAGLWPLRFSPPSRASRSSSNMNASSSLLSMGMDPRPMVLLSRAHARPVRRGSRRRIHPQGRYAAQCPVLRRAAHLCRRSLLRAARFRKRSLARIRAVCAHVSASASGIRSSRLASLRIAAAARWLRARRPCSLARLCTALARTAAFPRDSAAPVSKQVL